MATGFNTQTGGGLYRLQFETDNEEFFLLMQALARCCVDHPKTKTNADRIRAMSDEELAALICKHKPMCSWPKGVQKIFYSTRMTGEEAWTHWLQQPAEDDC